MTYTLTITLTDGTVLTVPFHTPSRTNAEVKMVDYGLEGYTHFANDVSTFYPPYQIRSVRLEEASA